MEMNTEQQLTRLEMEPPPKRMCPPLTVTFDPLFFLYLNVLTDVLNAGLSPDCYRNTSL